MDATFEHLIEHLGRETGLPDLALDNEGRCALRFDGQLIVEIERTAGTEDWILSCKVAEYNSDNELQVLRKIAGANLRWTGTGGATLAANTEAFHVVLAYKDSTAGLEWTRFEQLLQGFVETAFFWREKISSLETPVPMEIPELSALPPNALTL